jgi:hypothetical protein
MLSHIFCNRRAYAPACPGNQSDFSLQINTHNGSPQIVWNIRRRFICPDLFINRMGSDQIFLNFSCGPLGGAELDRHFILCFLAST